MAAKVYKEGLRQCVVQNRKYLNKINPLECMMVQSEFIARFRFPMATVRKIARGFGTSAFWDKSTDPFAPCGPKFVNAEWVVSTISVYCTNCCPTLLKQIVLISL